MSENEHTTLGVRVKKSDLEAFQKKCDSLRKNTSEVIRQMMQAMVEDRLTITPTEAERGIYK